MITVKEMHEEMSKLIKADKGNLPVFCDLVYGEGLNNIVGLQWLLSDGITQTVDVDSAEIVLIEYE